VAEKEVKERLKGRELKDIRFRGRERMWKRKREVTEGVDEGERGRGEEDYFKRSKKTMRTPPKGGGSEDEGETISIMGVLKEWMEDSSKKWERMEGSLRGIVKELEEMRKREEEWRVERRKLENRIEELEKKWEKGLEINEGTRGVENLEKRVNELESREREKGKGGERGGMEERIRKMEMTWERRERQERKRNVVVKGYKEDGGRVENKIKEIFEKIGAEVGIEEVRKVKTGREERGGMAVVRLKSEAEKEEVMSRKKGLKGEKIWIEDDLTWKERQSKWKMREVAIAEERKGARVFVGNNKMRIEGEWWF